jgi:aspartyl-tRNA(Asn)/glutamyl-tRNA(Gln) amidotransferase subunit A
VKFDRRRFVSASGGWLLWSESLAARAAAVERVPMTLHELRRQLSARIVTSRQLVEQALARIEDAKGEGGRAFIQVHRDLALATADRIDGERKRGASLPALAGIPISIKDNFDEAGVITRAGSIVLKNAAPAARDAIAVARLRAAGAVLIGRTNMTEFAYSGLGINPHYGTPRNAFDRAAARIPGGSSSGAAVSVCDGMAAAAIGTDTGGSTRIPAALNGLVGFKPTTRRVPLDGVLPLSLTLDSVGPIARTVADCALLDQVLSSAPIAEPVAIELRGTRLAVPQTVVLDELAPPVAAAFSTACTKLSAAGAVIVELPLREFARAAEVNPRGALSSTEAYWWHRSWIAKAADQYDSRVIARIRPGEAISAAEYIELLQQRRRFVADVESAVRGFDALLMPTTAETAPTIAEVVASDESYFRFNGRMLRNPALVNLFDGCALSIPCHRPGQAPVGLMLAGLQGQDGHVLSVGLAIEKLLSG